MPDFGQTVLDLPTMKSLAGISGNFVGDTDTQTFTNKTISGTSNTIVGFLFAVQSKKIGWYAAINGADAEGTMFQNSTYGSSSNVSDTSLGSHVQWNTSSSSGNNAGMYGKYSDWSASQNAYMWVKFKTESTASVAVYLGFTNNASSTQSATNPLGNSDSGVLIGLTSGSAAWQIMQNDGAGSSVIGTAVNQGNVDTNIHTAQIWCNSAGTYQYQIDANPVQSYLSANGIPAATTAMTWVMDVRNNTGSTRSLDIYGAYVQIDR